MDAQAKQFISKVKETLSISDGPLLVATAIGGSYNITGPRRINARAVSSWASPNGLKWSVRLSPQNTQLRPTLQIAPSLEWVPQAPPLSGLGPPEDAIEKWAQTQDGLRCALTPVNGRQAGCVSIIRFEADGVLTSSAVHALLQISRVVNVFVYAKSFEVWIARVSTSKGSLQHLSSINRISTHVGKIRRANKISRRVRKGQIVKRMLTK